MARRRLLCLGLGIASIALCVTGLLIYQSLPPTPMSPQLRWTVSELVNPNTVGIAGQGDGYGFAVSASEDYLFVGAPWQGENGTVRIYIHEKMQWIEVGQLSVADDTNFGFGVAADKNRLLVSSRHRSYLFVRDRDVWIQRYTFETGGRALDIDGNRLLIGTNLYVFDGSTWQIKAELIPENGPKSVDHPDWQDWTFEESLGEYSVSLKDDYALVGVNFLGEIVAYVFESVDDQWHQRMRFSFPVPPGEDDTPAETYTSVDTNTDRFVVSARWSDGGFFSEARVFVFEKTDTSWQESAQFTPPYKGDGYLLGGGVVLAGEDLFITHNGYVFVYHKQADDWLIQHEIAPAESSYESSARSALALNDRHLFVGNFEYDSASGVLYAIDIANPQTARAELRPLPKGRPRSLFGRDVAISMPYALVGAMGYAEFYEFDGTAWRYQTRFKKPGNFGSTVALTQHNAMIADDNTVYAYTQNGNVWREQQALRPPEASDIMNYAFFGKNIHLTPDNAAIGMQQHYGISAILLYADNNSWQADTRIEPSYHASQGIKFGEVFDRSEDMIVSFSGENSKITVHQKNATDWQQTDVIELPHKYDLSYQSDASLSVQDDLLLIGISKNFEQENAYLYRKTENGWQHIQTLYPERDLYQDGYAKQVLIHGERLFVSSCGAENEAVFIYERDDTIWRQSGKLLLPETETRRGWRDFGCSFDVSGEHVIVSAKRSSTYGAEAGKAFVFELMTREI